MQIQWPQGLDCERFLREYWQQKALFIPQALTNFHNPLSPDELAGLALEEEIPSRLIREHSRTEWSVEHGPFSLDVLQSLESGGWSLLVSDIEKHLPEFTQFLQPFRFLPDWQIDDLMISYAPTGASVGPHTDQYDVFLLQASGSREWRIGAVPESNATLIPGLELQILTDFSPAATFVTQPGDLLYLPPRLAHHGISRDNECMTWSVGFRAPSLASMLSDYALFIGEKTGQPIFQMPAEYPLQHPGLISQETIQQVYQQLLHAMTSDETLFSEWLGRYLTETAQTAMLNDQVVKDESLITQALNTNRELHRNTQARVAYMAGSTQCRLFADGHAYTCSQDLAEFLCSDYRYSATALKGYAGNQSNQKLLNTLLRRDILITQPA